jgi:hypothetical protein
MFYCYDRVSHLIVATLSSSDEVEMSKENGDIPMDVDVIRTSESPAAVHVLPTVIGSIG